MKLVSWDNVNKTFMKGVNVGVTSVKKLWCKTKSLECAHFPYKHWQCTSNWFFSLKVRQLWRSNINLSINNDWHVTTKAREGTNYPWTMTDKWLLKQEKVPLSQRPMMTSDTRTLRQAPSSNDDKFNYKNTDSAHHEHSHKVSQPLFMKRWEGFTGNGGPGEQLRCPKRTSIK